MCGRFCLTADWQAISEEFGVRNHAVLKLRYNICPGTPVLALRQLENLEFMNWGLRPVWLKPEQNAFINARSETILEKPSFKKAFQQHRCLIVATGYFEWKQIGRIKQPYFMHFADNKLFAMAGLWDGDGCAVITREASKDLQAIHNRMPVIITKDNYKLWLNHKSAVSDVQSVMDYDLHGLSYYAVSTRVNNPVNDVLECILPLQ